MDHYTLIINEEHARVMITALDCYSRMMIGQIDNALEPIKFQWDFKNRPKDKEVSNYNNFRDLCNQIKSLFTPFDSPGASYGIHSKEVDDSARVAYDIKKVIEHRLSFDRKPEGDITVNFDKPSQTSEQPLPIISVLINKEI
jgi:hypothetical protein